MPDTKRTMSYSCRCPHCGTFREVMVDPQQMRVFLSTPPSQRSNIQSFFPDLTPSEREALRTGFCDTCWDQLFGED